MPAAVRGAGTCHRAEEGRFCARQDARRAQRWQVRGVATAACLSSGAPGGLFTPTLTFGVLFGDLLGHGWAAIWPGPALGSYAITGGAAVLAASMQGPVSAVVLMLELTHTADGLMVPILLAVAEATIVARVLGAPSIYSARLNDDASEAAVALGPLEPEAPPDSQAEPQALSPP